MLINYKKEETLGLEFNDVNSIFFLFFFLRLFHLILKNIRRRPFQQR